MKKILCIIFYLFLFNVQSSEELDRLKDILEASENHGKMIKTIQAKVTIIKKDSRRSKPFKSQYKIIYRREDNHWKADFVRKNILDENNVNILTKDYTSGIMEQVEDTILTFVPESKSGVIEKNMNPQGFSGITIDGIFGSPGIKVSYKQTLDRIKNIFKNISIESLEYKGVPSTKIFCKGDKMSLTYIFVPSMQYSFTFSEFQDNTSDNVCIQTCNIDFQKDLSSNIWFPSKSVLCFYENNKMLYEKTIIFADIKLNQTITDEMICINLPQNSHINNDIKREIYDIDQNASLEDILSGKIKSVLEKDKKPITPSQFSQMLLKFIKMSLLMRLIIVLLITVLIFYVSIYVKQKIFTKIS